MKDSPVARLLGSGYAHLQHGIDRIILWGFRTMEKNTAGAKPKNLSKNMFLRTAQQAGRGTVSFIGQMGSAYFKTYEQLKQHSTKKEEH